MRLSKQIFQIGICLAFHSAGCAPLAGAEGSQPHGFVFPGCDGRHNAVWGHREGLRIGLPPTSGPRGLLRVYAPYLAHPFPRMVNFVSIEPMAEGDRHRGQSELEPSQLDPGEVGLALRSNNSMERPDFSGTMGPARGVIDEEGGTLTFYVHIEPFRNGTLPIVRVRFIRGRPYEVEFSVFAGSASTPMSQCVLSATMGNYGLLRELVLPDGRTQRAGELWSPREPLDRLGFLPWKAFPLGRGATGTRLALLRSELEVPSDAEYDPDVPREWRYRGRPGEHFWSWQGEGRVAVNARRTFWGCEAPIPGGAAIENFEIRKPFVSGQTFVFGVRPTGGGK